MRAAVRLAALAWPLMLLWGCATPGTEAETAIEIAPGERPPAASVEAGLWMVMDKAEQRLRTSGRLVEDERLQAYVRRLVCELAGKYCADIRVYVVRTPYFNASMAPNGYLEVWTGLLLRATNEAQLAYVLGHEMGHYLRRHSLEFWRDARRKTDMLVLVRLLSALGGMSVVGNVAQIVTYADIFANSRQNEREADRLGFELMTRAGYDPHEAPVIWRALLAERAAADEPGQMIFFATHPSTEERIDTLTALADEWAGGRPRGRTGRDRFLARVLPYRATMLRDELRLRRFARTQVVLDRLLADGVRPGELHYFQGELYRLRGERGDRAKAIEAYEAALAAGEAPAEAHRALGLMLARAGQGAAARMAFADYLAAAPEAADGDIVRAWLVEPAAIEAMARPERPPPAPDPAAGEGRG